MKLFYFELVVNERLSDTKVVRAENSWDAWHKFHDMYAGTWESELEEHSINNWFLVAYCTSVGTMFSGYHTCPTRIMNPRHLA